MNVRILEKIKQESSINGKKELLKQGMNREVELLLRMCYDNNIKFGINKKTIENALDIKYIDLDNFMDKYNCDSISYEQLQNIFYNCQVKSGNKLGQFVNKEFRNTCISEFRFIIKTLVKNLELGLSINSINQIFEELGLQKIDNIIVQLAKPIYIQDNKFYYKVKGEFKETNDVKFPCYSEIKYDGMRCVCEIKYKEVDKGLLGKVNELTVKLTSRENLDKTNEFPEIVEEVKRFAKLNNFDNIILDGEIITTSFNKLQSRFGTSQKNINKDNNLMFNVFDIREYKDKDLREYKYAKRLGVIKKIKYTNKIKLAEGKVCKTLSDIKDYYDEACNNQEEGIIIKNASQTYAQEKKDERKGQWKMKPFDEMDLRVRGFKEGNHIRKVNNKFINVTTLGSLVCESDDGIYGTDVGSGLTDEERDNIWNNQDNYLNKIVEVGYQDVTKKKDSEIYSLRFPTFRRWRFDRNESN